MRKPIIVANWKMNKTRDEALQFIYAIVNKLENKDNVDAVICSPALFLRCLVKRQGENLAIGAQNMHFQNSGAYTGEISAPMLKDLGVKYVIIGHSERREYFAENDESVNKKLLTALKNKLTPIVCVGETLTERENGTHKEKLVQQVTKAFENVAKDEMENVIIAYEPIWAIGTGETATTSQANEMCAYIREIVANLSNKKIASKVRIQYGGSVKPANIKELMDASDIDGALVGGASLEAESFLKLFEF